MGENHHSDRQLIQLERTLHGAETACICPPFNRPLSGQCVPYPLNDLCAEQRNLMAIEYRR
jgi:hypothetical protein